MATATATVSTSTISALRRTFPRHILRAFIYWLPFGVAITAMSGLVYGAVQQNFRQNANDPQVQMAEDAAAQLESGQQPQAIVGTAKVDIGRSLAPFYIVYDSAGNVLASSAQLDGQVPPLPSGVLSSTQQMGQDRLTWQPQEGVRSAAVVVRYGGSHPGYVLAGRSLREVEDRESRLQLEVGAAWVAGLAGSLVAMLFAVVVSERLFAPRA